ncbi:MAG: hypothetical protein DRJ40_00620 [Thermoprotei archaeon]|nr:MAG: hypothetical protein DRJ40_00620 [Thermoprotei archaeon]
MGYRELLELVRYARDSIRRDVIEEQSRSLIVSHYDADGLCSAAILSSTLARFGIPYHIKVFEQLDVELLKYIASLRYEVVFLLDMGSGVLNLVAEYLRDKKLVVIVDHHQPRQVPSLRENIIEVNPHRVNVDGSREVSTSSLTYFLARELLGGVSSCRRFIPLAIAGALGDRQDQGEKKKLIGVNRVVVEEGIVQGVISEEIGLRLYGLKTRPLVKCLEYTVDPYLPGLTGNEEMCVKFLKSLGIEPRGPDGRYRYFTELSEDEMRRMVIGLIRYLIEHGYTSVEAEEIFGYNYYNRLESEASPFYDLREFSAYMNACGRMYRHGLGILLGQGYRSRDVVEKVLETYVEYRKVLSGALRRIRDARDKYVRELEHIYVLNCRGEVSDRVLGAVASIVASSGILGLDKPLVALTQWEDYIKVSLRKTRDLRAEYREVNLGQIVEKVATEVGGVGGGHRDAAGAKIPLGTAEEFVSKLNEEIGAQAHVKEGSK